MIDFDASDVRLLADLEARAAADPTGLQQELAEVAQSDPPRFLRLLGLALFDGDQSGSDQ